MSQRGSRRGFLKQSLATSAALATAARAARAADAPNEAVVLGIIGTNGRGSDLARSFASVGGARIAYICDVDQRAIDKATSTVAGKQSEAPRGVKDLRRVFDDRSVEAVVIAAPDHWHAPATIMACAAGKHVYVEKPCSHNPREGELMVAAARKHNRVVQMGSQRRSMPGVIEAIDRVRGGEIGRVLYSRGWYSANRSPIGHGKPAAVPAGLDYALWQGPAPQREYRDNLIHYNWHWFWHWGTGELGNNGIHALDICRWGLGVDFPRRVTAGGGKYFFDDDQETPDTQLVTYDFGDKIITWEGRNWHHNGFENSGFGVAFDGERGSIVISSASHKTLDPSGKELSQQTKGFDGQEPHLRNFLAAIRAGTKPNAEIEEGHKGTLLCHLGNIAYRTGHTLNLDPTNGHVKDDAAAEALWSREYRPGWEPKV